MEFNIMAAISNAKFSHSFPLDLSEKVELPNGKKEHKRVATVNIPMPVLSDFGIDAEQYVYTVDDAKKDPKVKAGDKAFNDGLPIYANQVYDWLQGAILFRVSAMSRNRFVKGQLKPGASLAEDFEALTAETARTGDALALRREARTSFEAYLQKLGKKQATVQLLGELFFNSAKVLASAGDKYVEALSKYAGEWIETLTPEQATRFTPKLAELQESINNATSKSDLDDDLS
jgi:hypothetical protein